jgi:tRNA-(ms[2]io[6]A)-hydroxylase
LDEIMTDDPNCEKQAAGTVMAPLVVYVENETPHRDMIEIVNEELKHFHSVLTRLETRGVRFRWIKPSRYGRQLDERFGTREPGRAVDRLSRAARIEARSCERFPGLCGHVDELSRSQRTKVCYRPRLRTVGHFFRRRRRGVFVSVRGRQRSPQFPRSKQSFPKRLGPVSCDPDCLVRSAAG